MGKNSSKGKSERNIRDLCVRMRSTTCASCEGLRIIFILRMIMHVAVSLDYSSYLSEILVGQINRPDPVSYYVFGQNSFKLRNFSY